MSSKRAKQSNTETAELLQSWMDSIDAPLLTPPRTTHDEETGQTLTFEKVRIDFPLKPYPAQVQMMRNIVHTLNSSENALLESPTGSGKSLALLCAALAWREKATQIALEDFSKRRETIKQETADLIAELKEKAEQKEKTENDELSNILPEEEILRVQAIIDASTAPVPVNTEDASLNSITEASVASVEISSTPINTDTSGTSVASETAPVNTEISSAPVNTDTSVNSRPMPDLPLPVNWKKPLSPPKRENDENHPSNWRKKFKYDDSNVIKVDEDSFEDFQTSVKSEKQAADEKSEQEKFKTVPRIFVGSRTHKQISQLISELKSKTRYNPRTTVLGSREQLCIHPKVSRMPNKTEGCIKLLDKSGCSFKNKTNSVINHPALKGTNTVWDIEDIVKVGKRVRGCPYYASRKIYEFAEIVFCPYNYIIDPVIRSIMDINLKGNIVILDEAHNIEDSSREAGSYEVDEQMLTAVSKELNQIIINGYEANAHGHLEVVLGEIFDWITSNENNFSIKEYEALHCNWTGESILNKLADRSITEHTFHTVLTPALKTAIKHAEEIRKDRENQIEEEDQEGVSASQVQIFHRKCLTNNSLSIIQGLFMALGFIFRKGKKYEHDYQMILTKRIERARPANNNKRRRRNNTAMEPEWGYKLKFKCLNPGIIFRDMTETTKSVVLTSGTLSPLNTFASELETQFEGRLEANHVIHKSQVWVGAIPRGPGGITLKGIFTNWESFQYQDDIGESLCSIVETVPFGVLCFLPSYNSLDKLMSRWKVTGVYERLAKKKMIKSEPRGSDKKEFEETIGDFYKQIDNVSMGPDDFDRDGALFFAVFRGKVSEGIDFSDNYCRAVVTVGIPYPSVKDIEVQFKKQYNDKKKIETHNPHLLSGGDWYSAQAFRAINQALGRCIRHKNDWGAIILLEDRFQNPKNVDNLSKWVRGMLQVHRDFPDAMLDLAGFVQAQQVRTASLNVTAFLNATASSLETPPPQETKMAMLEESSRETSSTEETFMKLFSKAESSTVEEEFPMEEEFPISANLLEYPKNRDNAHNEQDGSPNQSKEDSLFINNMPDIQSELSDTSPFFPSETPGMSSAPLSNSMHPLIPEKLVTRVYVKGVVIRSKSESNKMTTVDTEEAVTSPLAFSPPTHPTSDFHSATEKTIPTHKPLYRPYTDIPLEEEYRFKEADCNSFVGMQDGFAIANSFEEPILINTDDDEEKLVELDVNQKPLENHTEQENHTERENYTEQENSIKQELEKKVVPVVFKAPELSAVSLVRRDFFSIGRDDDSFVCITCTCCGRILLEGPTRNIRPVAINDLALIANNSNVDRKNIVEISEPGEWESSVDFLGGPIDIKQWPNESSVTLNKEDGICYRSLQCSCPMSQSKGIIIRQSFGTRNSNYDGKVFLWLTQLQIQKDFKKINRSNLSYQPNDAFDMPSSQVSSMNDMFYSL